MHLNLVCFLAFIISLCVSLNQNVQFKANRNKAFEIIQIKPYLISVPDINNDYDIVHGQIYQKGDDKFKRIVPVDEFVLKNLNYVQPQIIATVNNQQIVQKHQNKEEPIIQNKNNVKRIPYNNPTIMPKLNNENRSPQFKIHQINNPSQIVHYPFEKIQKLKPVTLQQNEISKQNIPEHKNIQQSTKQEQNLVPIKSNPIQKSKKVDQKQEQYSQQFIKNQVRIQILRRQRQKNLAIFRYVTFGLVLLALSTVLCLKKQKKKPVRYTPIDLQQQNFVV